MTELRVEPYELPAADVGGENPLPFFRGPDDDIKVGMAPSLPEEDRRYLGWRAAHRVLPYRMQDRYSREKRPYAFRAAVLENEALRATFLPQVGGRLVSLFHKPADRELLDLNPVFQPANLALRNAWFSGGIEWNTGHFGHHYLTCSPVFAARVDADGYPVLRLYEWERQKRFPWQIDFHLPPGSQFLFARVRLLNPHAYELPMYWWTNMAVEEKPGRRTVVPADDAIHPTPEGFGVDALPNLTDFDATYATNHPGANEMFFRIPDGRRHWVAALDPDGTGFVETSTERLRGRKMFVWGIGTGGRRWQEYLAAPGRAYLEIQAGLARTQIEHVPMPGSAVWTWTEAFGLLRADPARVHGRDWSEAREAAAEALRSALRRGELEALDRQFAAVTARPPEEVLAAGAGWGALERRRAAASGEPDALPAELPFGQADLGPEQAPWLALLEQGALLEADPAEGPGAYMVQPEWRQRLEEAVAAGRGDHWLSWLHLGVMRMEDREVEGARQAWQTSLERRPTAWALRNLSVLARREERPEEATDLLRKAWEAGPQVPSLAAELADALHGLSRYPEVLAFADSLPEEIRREERVTLAAARAALEMGEYDRLAPVFEREFATIREGEVTLSDLWFRMHERRIAEAEGREVDDEIRKRVRREFPPPQRIDYRMAAEKEG